MKRKAVVNVKKQTSQKRGGGKKKIDIKPVKDFIRMTGLAKKRKGGFFKKGDEFGVLTNSSIFVFMFNESLRTSDIMWTKNMTPERFLDKLDQYTMDYLTTQNV